MLVNPNNVEVLKKALSDAAPTGSFLPAVYVLELTGVCDLACIMCPHDRMRPSRKSHIPLDRFKYILDLIAPTAELVMLYFMGESTLHPDFSDALKMAREKLKGRIVISSNMAHVSGRDLEAMAEFADLVICPIDRWSQRSYEAIRRGANFNAVVSNVKRLCELSVDRGAKVVPKLLGLTLGSTKGGSLDEGEIRSFEDYWLSLGATPLAGWVSTWAGQIPSLGRHLSIPVPVISQPRQACADLWFKMVILHSGDVVLCCNDYAGSHIVGNVLSSGVAEVWHSARIISLRENHAEGHFACTALCRGCHEWATPSELDCYLRLEYNDLFVVF